MKFVKILKNLREDREVTQSEIAEILGVKQSAVSKYEREEREYKVEDIIKLCRFYKVSADYVLGLTNEYKELPKK